MVISAIFQFWNSLGQQKRDTDLPISLLVQIDKILKLNPDYDESIKYIPRSERPEWTVVGMLGMLRARDDGSCKVGGYCKVNENGIATASESGYYVTKRFTDNIIEVFFK